ESSTPHRIRRDRRSRRVHHWLVAVAAVLLCRISGWGILYRGLRGESRAGSVRGGIGDMQKQPTYKLGLIVSLAAAGCTMTKMAPSGDAHADHITTSSSSGISAALTAADTSSAIPPDAAGAPARLSASPRPGGGARISTGDTASVKAWVVSPGRSPTARG